MTKDFSFGLPLKQRFTEYVAIPGAILPHEIERIRTLWGDGEAIEAEVSGDDQAQHDELRKGSILGLDNTPENIWLYERLAGLVAQANNEIYWFDLLGFQEELQLMRYSGGDFFNWHLDFGPGPPSSRKLSITVQLSKPEDYDGGSLQFQINDKQVDAPNELGTVVIFPSFIMHRVTRITRGERQSIVGWVGGSPYR